MTKEIPGGVTGQEGTLERPPLPQIELREIKKSPQPIVEKGKKPEEIIIQEYKDYLVVLGTDPKEIKIFTREGKEIEDFKTLARLQQSINFIGIVGNAFKYRSGTRIAIISKDAREPLGYSIQGIYDIPPYQREFIRYDVLEKAFASHSSEAVYDFSTEEITLIEDPKKTAVVQTEKYLIFFNKESKGYVAYITQDERGFDLPPRQWQRIDPTMAGLQGTIPKDLEKLIENLAQVSLTMEPINDQYSAIVSPDRIEIAPPFEKPIYYYTIDDVGKNICHDPNNPSIIYFCRTAAPNEIIRLDTTGPPPWKGTEQKPTLSTQYPRIENLQLDPSGNFFFFSTGQELIFLTRDTLQEVGRKKGLTGPHFAPNGELYALDQDGYLVTFQTNFAALGGKLAEQRAEMALRGIKIGDLFQQQDKKASSKDQAERFKHLDRVVAEYSEQFNQQLTQANSFESIAGIRSALESLKKQLIGQRITPEEINYIIAQISPLIETKEKTLALESADPMIELLRKRLAEGNLSMAMIGELRKNLQGLNQIKTLLEEPKAREITTMEEELTSQIGELFKKEGELVSRQIEEILTRTEKELSSLTSMGQKDDWMEFSRPQIWERICFFLSSCPIEAVEIRTKILEASKHFNQLCQEYDEKFAHQYAKIREQADAQLDERVQTLKDYTDSFFGRTGRKGFKIRSEADRYLENSPDYKTILQEIEAISLANPEKGKILQKELKARIANFLAEVEQGTYTQIAETGQQMVVFGQTQFPRWEAQVTERAERLFELVFIEDKTTHGPGVGPDQIRGDVGVKINTSNGRKQTLRLWEGIDQETDWRYGGVSLSGKEVPPSYLTFAEYRQLKKDYTNWQQEDSSLRNEFLEKRAALRDLYHQRPRERTSAEHQKWQEEYLELFSNYQQVLVDHHLPLLRRFDRIKKIPEDQRINGFGYVPEWKSHWVMDRQTEIYLEQIAKHLKMQAELQEGVLNLVGHAGSGKDVSIQMFCHRTNRPYFPVDCTKWTTEIELSEDWFLEVENGATYSAKLPSQVLNAITTPGAVLYFNEFNAMPEQTQIFLHSLLDEKRTITLKTRSGKSIKAHPSVLFLSSMNPGYRGTFEPQYATKSRMIEMKVDYPPLYRPKTENDPNPNPPYDYSEALRIARNVDSLDDLTYDPNPDHNDFVKLWDHYVNGLANGSTEPTQMQKFDLEVILALIQFGTKLREEFILNFEKKQEGPKALPVTQPLTPREMRRAGYELDKMSEEKKLKTNPEQVARDLIDQFLLCHIYGEKDLDTIRKAMATWTSAKRVS